MPNDPDLAAYYARRAGEYEQLYSKPERQADLAALKKLCQQSLAHHRVLEVACGTGYWSQVVAEVAESLAATDINQETIEIARTKAYRCPVIFHQADAFQLESLPSANYTAGMAMAWWSHLRKSEVKEFLVGFHHRLQPGALVVMMDNRFVPGQSTPISRTDGEGNTYQWRPLVDGSRHEVLKNFPSQDEMRGALDGIATDFHWIELPYYWFLTYRTSGLAG